MALGNQPVGVATGPTTGPRVPSSRGAIGDLWQPEHVPVAAQIAGAQVLTKGPLVTRLQILERSGAVLYIGLDRPATAQDYDLLHPGRGWLDLCIPPTAALFLIADAAVAPTTPLEVLLRGGLFRDLPT